MFTGLHGFNKFKLLLRILKRVNNKILFFRFLRPQKEYIPKKNVQSELDSIYTSVLGTTDPNTQLTDIKNKFNLLKACEDKLEHTVPSSQLHSMLTLADVTRYFKTPVDVRTPYDKLKDMELPENLHVQFDYLRFPDCKFEKCYEIFL